MFDNGCAHKVERGLKETLMSGLVDEYVDNLDPDNYPISTHPRDYDLGEWANQQYQALNTREMVQLWREAGCPPIYPDMMDYDFSIDCDMVDGAGMVRFNIASVLDKWLADHLNDTSTFTTLLEEKLEEMEAGK